MSCSSFFPTYAFHRRFCERLDEAARKEPVFGSDPIHHITHVHKAEIVIDPALCDSIADRMEALAAHLPYMGELARSAQMLAERLRAAAQDETPFYLR